MNNVIKRYKDYYMVYYHFMDDLHINSKINFINAWSMTGSKELLIRFKDYLYFYNHFMDAIKYYPELKNKI